MENIIKIDNGSFEGFEGVTAGVQQGEHWQYDPIGYNATRGVFYIGEVESPMLDMHPPLQVDSTTKRAERSALKHFITIGRLIE